ncbi:mitochondrial matrix acidic protein, putative [Candida dubliniensis CD36]|uniref:Mitochondrial matrix acidic protein, putative n=1 Tax=Candida dubliniensis (strain CD36 / ATCC MYA-646 / CBS 7987 / NCPF 3949 / NRRL Y-17841) TaxID=573826 RepID=B9WJV2_CANDC|nr:mitochondrial matrix acidic protein, putative [Candida dubliniensis CD36]CAX40911.1 mitochondrial matrix acidic protein, putative [Candida dubliniensis CD36]
MSRLLSTTLRSQLSKRLVASASRPPKTLLATLPKAITTTSLRSFHNTPIAFNQTTTTAESDLKQILDKELQVVEAIPNELDQSHVDFLESSGFKVVSKPGNANVELVKKDDQGQLIHVYFDVEDVTDIPAEELELEGQELEEEAESLDQIFSNVKVLIENPTKNEGLFFSLMLQASESAFLVDYVNTQADVKKFISKIDNEGEFADKFNYQGPKFGLLDESLQVEFENYLVAKGIDEQLADFIIGYSDVKEETEYRTWLSSVNKFFK